MATVKPFYPMLEKTGDVAHVGRKRERVGRAFPSMKELSE